MWNRDTFIYRLRKLLGCWNDFSLVALACVKLFILRGFAEKESEGWTSLDSRAWLGFLEGYCPQV